jgi:hypothetical protein
LYAGSHISNLPTPTDFINNPYGQKLCLFWVIQKSASMVVFEIALELQPWWPIFEKCSHLRDKELGGADAQILKSDYADPYKRPSPTTAVCGDEPSRMQNATETKNQKKKWGGASMLQLAPHFMLPVHLP